MKNRGLHHAGLTLIWIVASACSNEEPTTNGPQNPFAGSGAGFPTAGSPMMMSPLGSAGTPAVPVTPPSGTEGAQPVAPAAGSDAPAQAGNGAMAGSDAMLAGNGATAGTDAPVSTAGKLPRVDTTDGPGPFDGVEKVMTTPPGGWLIYPTDIGRDGIKHPIFVFGPGGGTTPMTYETSGMHWDRYGSYGFVIYVLPRSTGDGAAMKAGLDWLFEENDNPDSPLYQHLDTSKVCASGHSMGSVTTFDFMPDERVTTTIHISGGSFDGLGPSNLSTDTMFLCGPSASADMAVTNCDRDFTNSTVPTYYTKIQGSDHLTSGRLGWAAIIAWMLWHLADQEEQWKPEFLEPDGQFQTGIYQSQTKNW